MSSKKSSAGSPSKGARQSADGADGNIEETKKQGIQVPETAGTEQEDEALNAAQMVTRFCVFVEDFLAQT